MGERLFKIRQSRGMTQTELATAAGMSQRMVSHYECEIENPSAEMIARLAKALQVSTDEILGVKTVRKIDEEPTSDPVLRRYRRRIQQLAELPERDRRAVIRMLDGLTKASVTP